MKNINIRGDMKEHCVVDNVVGIHAGRLVSMQQGTVSDDVCFRRQKNRSCPNHTSDGLKITCRFLAGTLLCVRNTRWFHGGGPRQTTYRLFE